MTEMSERLTDIEESMALLESAPSPDVINDLFRSIHTIKGGSGFFGMNAVQNISHTMEDLLMQIRDGILELTPEMTASLFTGFDRLRDMSEMDDYGESLDISDAINAILASQNKSPVSQNSTDNADAGSATANSEFSIPDSVWMQTNPNDTVYHIKLDLDKVPPEALSNGIKSTLDVMGDVLMLVPDEDQIEQMGEKGVVDLVYNTVLDIDMIMEETGQKSESIKLLESPDESSNVATPIKAEPAALPLPAEKKASKEAPAKKPAAKPNTPTPKAKKAPVAAKKEVKQETIRVNIDLLNKLMDLTGEIVLGRNQLMRQFENEKDTIALQGMAHMISDLQQVVMQTRMQPVGSTFTKFNRIVRDLAKMVGKQIRLVVKGEETELDRSILEALSDPLTHLIRNCADHALEVPEERTMSGKDVVGTITLNAYQAGGQVAIEVEDDGKGIPVHIVKSKAVANGVISQAEADSMSDQEAAKLIFAAGFSTADEVTDISGRGVGMDVVKTSFEKVGGVVNLETYEGQGTKVTIHLPMTLAIMSSLIIMVEKLRFAIPQSDIREVIVLRPEDKQKIEKIRGEEVFRLRGQLIPILKLSKVVGLKNSYTDKDGNEQIERRDNLADRREEDDERIKVDRRRKIDEKLFLVLNSGGHLFGLIIDKIDHTEEIVVKPMPKILKSLTYYSGSAILGDGDVAMVLSTNGICQKEGLQFQELNTTSHGSGFDNADGQVADMQEKQSLLIFTHAHGEQFAIPLSLVFKVETVQASKVQTMSDKQFVNLEGRNFLLVHLDTYLDVLPGPKDIDTYYLIIPKVEDFNVAIVATSIVESTELRLVMDDPPIPQAGVLGITTIHDNLTYILDLFSLFEVISPERFKKQAKGIDENNNQLLVVEDTPFFRNLQKAYFESVGYEVTLANNGKEALDLLQSQPDRFALIVSDIVMPVMDGYDLIKNIRGLDNLKHLPVVALTSFSEEQNKSKALDAGFDAYEVKTNKDSIINCVKNISRRG
jgi:two-component system chemotaxis sensor kinase CheA